MNLVGGIGGLERDFGVGCGFGLGWFVMEVVVGSEEDGGVGVVMVECVYRILLLRFFFIEEFMIVKFISWGVFGKVYLG